MASWVGVDVGASRKGLHVCRVSEGSTVTVSRLPGPHAVERLAEQLARCRPTVVAIDSPAEWAPDGRASRPDERDFVRAGICNIRYTPDRATADARRDGYYDWIRNGLSLYAALAERDVRTIEVFPTASWTVWLGRRGARSRARWTAAGVTEIEHGRVDGLDRVRNQDDRDALAAALTARLWTRDPAATTSHGPLVVPDAGTFAMACR